MTDGSAHSPAWTLGVHPPRPQARFRVGITGHRIQSGRSLDQAAIDAALRQVFDGLEAAFSAIPKDLFDVSAPQFVLLSGLADGADQMAARALRAGETPGIERRLEAILPFHLDAYADTFRDVGAAAEMRQLAGGADACFVLGDWQPPAHPGPVDAYWRDQRYRTGGDLIVSHSDVLITVWDGLPAAGVGGTGDVVASAVRMGVPVIWIGPRDGSVRLIHPRAGTVPAGFDDLFLALPDITEPLPLTGYAELVRTAFLPPHATEKPSELRHFFERESVKSHSWAGLYHRVIRASAHKRAHGKAATSVRVAIDSTYRTLADWLEGASSGAGQFVRPMVRALGPGWAASDAVGARLGHHYRSIYVIVFALAALATTVGVMGLPSQGFGLPETLFAGGEIVILLLALFVSLLAHFKGQHARWLHAREIAERLRAQSSRTLIGFGRPPTAADGQGWTTWLFRAYARQSGVPDAVADRHTLCALAGFIRQHIVRDQMAYHEGNAHVLEHIHSGLERWGSLFLIAALASSGSLLAVVSLPGEHESPWREHLQHVLVAASAAIPAIGAAVTGIRFQGDFQRFARRSLRTHYALSRIDLRLQAFERLADLDDTAVPLYEELADITGAIERALIGDIDDWYFAYELRAAPSPG